MHKYYVHALAALLSGSPGYEAYQIRHPFPPYATHYAVLLGLTRFVSYDLVFSRRGVVAPQVLDVVGGDRFSHALLIAFCVLGRVIQRRVAFQPRGCRGRSH